MKGLGILSLRWATAAIVTAALVAPQRLGAQVPAQGIKVHGHWVIEVRNADGSLQLRREFENALTDNGKRILADVLAGQTAMGGWEIVAVGGLCIIGGSATDCFMVEPAYPFPDDSRTFKNLTKTVTGAFALVLQGNFVAANNGSVMSVQTIVFPPGFVFTSQNLVTPIPVQATQTVSVTVTFTFS